MRTKDELRALLKDKRASLSHDEKKAMDAAIVSRIAQSKVYQNASTLLLYAPLAGEINLLPLVRLARKQGKTVAFPRCDVATNTMQFYILEPEARLVAGAYHIPEPPADAPLCQPDEKAICILPALTFDLSGARLGYGKGYYDRFLATFPGVTVGAAYESFLIKQVPVEAHDLPVSMIFTDRAMHVCRNDVSTVHTEEKKPLFFAGVRKKTADMTEKLRRMFKGEKSLTVVTEGETAEGEAAKKSFLELVKGAHHAPPTLVGVIFLLLLLSRPIDTLLTDRNNEYAVVILLQVLIFLIPAVVYGKLRGDAFSARIRLRTIRPEHALFTVCMLVVMITGGMLCSILTGGIASLGKNFTLYETFVARTSGGFLETAYVILAYGVLPAFCEELVFRSILCAEYEKLGVGVSIAASALFFAMLHFSFPLFLTYLLLGMLLAGAMYTTRSFFAAFLLHLCYNVFCLFGQPYLSAFYVNAGSNEIFMFCLVVLFLLFAAFAAGEARKLYHRYARANLDSSYTADIPMREQPKNFLLAMLSPATAVCLVIWLIVSLV